jgi:glycosyltransferase involved in cell wall biosynthesis
MMKNGLVSIIVPVYNTERYLSQCIESIIQQSYSNIEILLINDGSTDSSASICDLFSKTDSRIKVIHQKNQGVSVARNKGIEESSGSWIIFVDSDDWIDLCFCEVFLKKALEEKADIVGCNLVKEIRDKKESSVFSGDAVWESSKIKDLVKLSLHKNIEKGSYVSSLFTPLVGPCCKIFRKSLVKNIRFPLNIKYAEDAFFIFQLLSQVKKVVWIHEEMYHYRFNEFSLVNHFDSGRMDNNAKVDQLFLDYIRIHYPDDKEVLNSFYQGCFTRIIRTFHHYVRNSKSSFFVLRKELKSFISRSLYNEALTNIQCHFKSKTQKIQLYLLKKRWISILILFIKMNGRRLKK